MLKLLDLPADWNSSRSGHAPTCFVLGLPTFDYLSFCEQPANRLPIYRLRAVAFFSHATRARGPKCAKRGLRHGPFDLVSHATLGMNFFCNFRTERFSVIELHCHFAFCFLENLLIHKLIKTSGWRLRK